VTSPIDGAEKETAAEHAGAAADLPDISRLMTGEESQAVLDSWNRKENPGQAALPSARRIEILPFQGGGKKYALVSDNHAGEECERMLSFLLSASEWCSAGNGKDTLRTLSGTRGRYYACVRAANPLLAGTPPSDERSFSRMKALFSEHRDRLCSLLRKSWAEGARKILAERGIDGEPALSCDTATARRFADAWNHGRREILSSGFSPETACPSAEVVRLPAGQGYAVVLAPFLEETLAMFSETRDALAREEHARHQDGEGFFAAALAAARPDLSYLTPRSKEATFAASVWEYRRCLAGTSEEAPFLPEKTIESIRRRREHLVRGLFSLLKNRATAEMYAGSLADRKAIIGRQDLLLKGYLAPPRGIALPVTVLFEERGEHLWLVVDREIAEQVSFACGMAEDLVSRATRLPAGERRKIAEEAVFRYHLLMHSAVFPCPFRTRAERFLRTERARRAFLRWRKTFLLMAGEAPA